MSEVKKRLKMKAFGARLRRLKKNGNFRKGNS
jgi:hypothetical protein